MFQRATVYTFFVQDLNPYACNRYTGTKYNRQFRLQVFVSWYCHCGKFISVSMICRLPMLVAREVTQYTKICLSRRVRLLLFATIRHTSHSHCLQSDTYSLTTGSLSHNPCPTSILSSLFALMLSQQRNLATQLPCTDTFNDGASEQLPCMDTFDEGAEEKGSCIML
jgi:hypothetical protein